MKARAVSAAAKAVLQAAAATVLRAAKAARVQAAAEVVPGKLPGVHQEGF